MRTERDSMGEMAVPVDALYGASTQRAVLNFPVSGRPLPAPFIRGLGLIKCACAEANVELGLLASDKGRLIRQAAQEIAAGRHDAQFPVDVFQTGSATSTNVNANEVIANRASQVAGRPIGSRDPVHPNDDVNLGQSSNDIIPSALHLSVALELRDRLVPALERLGAELGRKSEAFAPVIKVGRTHLMDATPLTLGQEFSGYAAQARRAVERVQRAIERLHELAVGGTAVGTGLNTHPEFGTRVCRILERETGIPFREARNHFEAQAARDDCAEVAGALAAVAGAMIKIAGDIRLLGSGPRSGLGEIRLPATQPGSSIMPGKVNPVMSEMLIQAGYYVQGLTQVVTRAAAEGQFELNATLPLQTHCLHESIQVLAGSIGTFADRCVAGLEADAARCRELLERSLMLVTALNPHIGYDQAALVAKEALATGRTLREIVLERGLMKPEVLDRALDPSGMVGPGGDPRAGAGG